MYERLCITQTESNYSFLDNQEIKTMSRYQMPTKTQLYSVVKGDDRYQPKRFPWYAVFAIAVALYGLYWLFTESF